jgi:hypothetical protein
MSNEYKVKWPDIRKSLFSMIGDEHDSKTRCFTDHAYGFHSDDSNVSSEYLRCADMAIWAQKNDVKQPHPDGLFMPIIYLYRHSLELALKNIIHYMYYAKRLPELPDKELGKHDLILLWNIVRPVLCDTWSKEDRSPVNNTQALIEDFQKIDKLGQNFRYSYQKNGKRTSDKYPEIICLDHLKEAVHEVHTFISACQSHYYDEFQSIDSTY